MARDRKYIESEIRKDYELKIRKKTISAFYPKMAGPNNEWLRRVMEARKDLFVGDMMMFSFSDHFKARQDKEVALILCLLINSREYLRVAQCEEELLGEVGESPFLWVTERRYASSCHSSSDILKSLRIEYRVLSALGNRLYETIEDYGCIENYIARYRRGDAADAFVALVSDIVRYKAERLRYLAQLLMINLTGNGLEKQRIWENVEYTEYPESEASIRFVNIFFYRGKDLFSYHEKAKLMGFDTPVELFHAYLAYSELKKQHGDQLTRYERKFIARTRCRGLAYTSLTKFLMRKIIPPITL